MSLLAPFWDTVYVVLDNNSFQDSADNYRYSVLDIKYEQYAGEVGKFVTLFLWCQISRGYIVYQKS